MKTIAYWSSNHKLAARILIVVCYILIIYLASYVGIGLQQHHMLLSPAVFYISVSVFLSCNLLFTQCYHFFSFNKRNLLDFVVGLCSFIIVISITIQQNISHLTVYTSLNGSFYQKNVSVSEPHKKPSLKELKKQFKELKKISKDGTASTGGVVLAVLVGLFLTSLLAAGSCSLACNQQSALAILLAIGGLTAIFFICKAIISFTRKKAPN